MSRSNQPPTMIQIPQPVMEEVKPEHRCAICNFSTKTPVGLARHVHDVHGYRGIADALSNNKR